MEAAAGRPDAGPSTIRAAIAAVHAEADSFDATDWEQIVALYSMLLGHGEDPVVRMNRAIAVGRARRPQDGLDALLALAGEPMLARHHPYHAALALFHEELGQVGSAVAAWRRAIDLVDNGAERRFLERRLARTRERS